MAALSLDNRLERRVQAAPVASPVASQGLATTLAQAASDVWSALILPAAETRTTNLKPEKEENPLTLLVMPNLRMPIQAVLHGIEEAGRAIEQRTGQDNSPSYTNRNHWDKVAAEEMFDVRVAQTQTGNLGAQETTVARGTGNAKADIVNEFLANAVEQTLSNRITSTARTLPEADGSVVLHLGEEKTLSGNFLVHPDGKIEVLDGQLLYTDGSRPTRLRNVTLGSDSLRQSQREREEVALAA